MSTRETLFFDFITKVLVYGDDEAYLNSHIDSIIIPIDVHISGTPWTTLVSGQIGGVFNVINLPQTIVTSGVRYDVSVSDGKNLSVSTSGNSLIKIPNVAESFIQVNVTSGTSLLTTQNTLPLNSGTVISGSSQSFTLNSNTITICSSGTYAVDWNVTGDLGGSSILSVRRNLKTDLNQNGTILDGSLSSAIVFIPGIVDSASAGGHYIITTTGHETIGIRTRDTSGDSTLGITFTTVAGYLSIQLIK